MRRAPRRTVSRAGTSLTKYDPNHELTDGEIAGMTKDQMDKYISTQPVLTDPDTGK